MKQDIPLIGPILNKIIGTRNERFVKQYTRRVNAINALEPEMRRLTDAQLRGKIFELRARLDKGTSADDLLIDAFAVARDGRPFIIRTPDATVQVLGTRFEVRAAEGQHGSRVQVEEGKVAVTAGRGRLVLTAGQGARVTPEGLQPQPVARQGVATWRTGGLAALDEPISAVLEELARRFSVEITTDATVDARATVSLFYPTVPGVERVLSDLCAAQNLSFIRTSRGFRVQGAVRAP
jgi:hypothetical protein